MQYMMETDQQSGREGSHHLGGLGGQALGPSAPSNSQDLGDGLHKPHLHEQILQNKKTRGRWMNKGIVLNLHSCQIRHLGALGGAGWGTDLPVGVSCNQPKPTEKRSIHQGMEGKGIDEEEIERGGGP